MVNELPIPACATARKDFPDGSISASQMKSSDWRERGRLMYVFRRKSHEKWKSMLNK